jgi:hypothetical protein
MSDLSIFFILDGSGSMSGVQKEVVDGLNDFIQEQKDEAALGTNVVFSLTVFDYKPTIVYMAEDINSVTPITKKDTFLGGGTALYDAIGTTLEKAKSENLPGKKLVAIYTDGYENSSVEWTPDKVKNLIKELENDGDWTVIFMSAEINDFATAQNLGVAAGNYTVVRGGAAGMSSTMSGLSQATHAHTVAAAASTGTFFGDYANSDLTEAMVDFERVNVVEPGTEEDKAEGNISTEF